MYMYNVRSNYRYQTHTCTCIHVLYMYVHVRTRTCTCMQTCTCVLYCKFCCSYFVQYLRKRALIWGWFYLLESIASTAPPLWTSHILTIKLKMRRHSTYCFKKLKKNNKKFWNFKVFLKYMCRCTLVSVPGGSMLWANNQSCTLQLYVQVFFGENRYIVDLTLGLFVMSGTNIKDSIVQWCSQNTISLYLVSEIPQFCIRSIICCVVLIRTVLTQCWMFTSKISRGMSCWCETLMLDYWDTFGVIPMQGPFTTFILLLD